MKPKGEKVTDYAWMFKGRKYWNIWVGNPFCISLYKWPLSMSKKEVVNILKVGQKQEKNRFEKEFSDIEWEDSTL